MPARIVSAMCELKERRDMGELVHEILEEVATEHDVPLRELRKRAEISWGCPLENDRERHSGHFEMVANGTEIAAQARRLARAIYEANLPGIKEFDFWEVGWEREIEDALKSADIDAELEPIARKHFLEEAARLERSIRMTRASLKSEPR